MDTVCRVSDQSEITFFLLLGKQFRSKTGLKKSCLSKLVGLEKYIYFRKERRVNPIDSKETTEMNQPEYAERQSWSKSHAKTGLAVI